MIGEIDIENIPLFVEAYNTMTKESLIFSELKLHEDFLGYVEEAKKTSYKEVFSHLDDGFIVATIGDFEIMYKVGPHEYDYTVLMWMHDNGDYDNPPDTWETEIGQYYGFEEAVYAIMGEEISMVRENAQQCIAEHYAWMLEKRSYEDQNPKSPFDGPDFGDPFADI